MSIEKATTFRVGPNNKLLTQALFVEQGGGPYSFKELREYFLELDDPTCYDFAVSLFESWHHFKVLMSLDWFSKHINEWLEELEMKKQAEGLKYIADEVRRDGKQAMAAAKFLVNKDWVTKGNPRTKRGRPSNAEKEAFLKQEAGIDKDLAADADRILN